MELHQATVALAALAQQSRLEIFRLLVSSGSELCAGEIAEKLDVPKSTLSFHLKELTQAGLVEARKDARSMIYRVRSEGIRDLLGFLTEDCCQGRPELCLPAATEPCCASTND
jgi:ArsR family transcriptional regulator